MRSVMLADTIGANVLRIRLARGLTADALAASAGCPVATVLEIEAGGSASVSRTLLKLANALDVPLSILFQEAR